MKSTITQELLFAHFEGRTTPLQIELLREWLQDPANQQYYYACLQEWEAQHPQVMTDPDAAFARFEQQIYPSTAPVRRPGAGKRRLFGWRSYLIAASMAGLLLTIGYLTQRYWSMRTIATDYGEVRSVILPDGSRVTLNANSRLHVPRFRFGPSSREVYLQGEAEFAVVHTPTHQRFRVHTTDEVEVIVLGTEFVVNTRRNKTRVVLNQGKVQLRYPGPDRMNTLTMQPGDWVSLTAHGRPKRGRQSLETAAAAAWKNYQYDFRRTPLSEVATLLTDNFGLQVTVSSAVSSRTVTGTFHARNADELLQALTELFDVQVTHKGNVIKLIPADSTRIDN